MNQIKKGGNDIFRNNKKSSKIYIIILSIFLSIFIYSLYKLYKIYEGHKFAIEEYDNLENYIKEVTSNNDDELSINIDFDSLKDINKDIVGWIYFENIDINYPIVKGVDNSYYLNHTFQNNFNSSGSIFMDYRNDSEFKDLNTVIYGHNMRNGAMFGNLMNLKDEGIYKENLNFWVLTNGSKYKCEIFSVYIDESTSESYNLVFKNKEEYSKYLNMIIERSIYNTGIKPTTDDLVVTLSTCATAEGSTRFIVHAKVEKIE
ncbi:class B sortase [Clostridium tertium]